MAEQGRQEGDNDMTAAGRQEAPNPTEDRGHDPKGGTAASFGIPVPRVKQTVGMPSPGASSPGEPRPAILPSHNLMRYSPFAVTSKTRHNSKTG